MTTLPQREHLAALRAAGAHFRFSAVTRDDRRLHYDLSPVVLRHLIERGFVERGWTGSPRSQIYWLTREGYFTACVLFTEAVSPSASPSDRVRK